MPNGAAQLQASGRASEALGGLAQRAQRSKQEAALAVNAARAIGADFLGVDLLPLPDDGSVVIEVNGAVDFDAKESLRGRNVYADSAEALALVRVDRPFTESPRSAVVRVGR